MIYLIQPILDTSSWRKEDRVRIVIMEDRNMIGGNNIILSERDEDFTWGQMFTLSHLRTMEDMKMWNWFFSLRYYPKIVRYFETVTKEALALQIQRKCDRFMYQEVDMRMWKETIEYLKSRNIMLKSR